jgi:hypothetical protein
MAVLYSFAVCIRRVRIVYPDQSSLALARVRAKN